MTTIAITFDLKHPQRKCKPICMGWCKCVFAQYTIWANAVDEIAFH